jgi:hypothetical protein
MSNLGYPFEIETLKHFQELEDGTSKKSYRVYGSGRNKLSIHIDPEANLDGDIVVKLDFLDKDIGVECKHYKPRNKKERSISVKKEWLDQNLEESEKNNEYSLVAIKFKNTKHNNIHYILPKDHFLDMLRYIKKLKKEIPKSSIQEYSSLELIDELKYRIINEN